MNNMFEGGATPYMGDVFKKESQKIQQTYPEIWSLIQKLRDKNYNDTSIKSDDLNEELFVRDEFEKKLLALADLNFSDIKEMLRWFTDISKVANGRHVENNDNLKNLLKNCGETIARVFAQKGFLPDSSRVSQTANSEEYGRWLVSTALSQLQDRGYVSPLFENQVLKWEKDFGQEVGF